MVDAQFVYPSFKYLVLYGTEAIAFLLIAAYCARRIRRVWAVLGLLGGLIGGLAALVYALGWGMVEWGGNLAMVDAFASDRFLSQMEWAVPVATVLLGLALVLASRSRPTQQAPPNE